MVFHPIDDCLYEAKHKQPLTCSQEQVHKAIPELC